MAVIARILGLAAMVASSCTATPLLKPRQSDCTAPSRYVFVFGDSYTTTRYNVSLQPQPSLDSPLANPGYPGATLSGFDNWIDVVVYKSSFDCIVAYNYAVGGNTVNNTQVMGGGTAATGPVVDFIDQNNEFAQLSGVPLTGDNSLFFNWFGINDITQQIYNGRNESTSESILTPDLYDFRDQLEKQYSLGARNFITILVPPIYRAPVFDYGNSGVCPEVQNLTTYWNDFIQYATYYVPNKYSDAKAYIIDPSPTFNNILDNPTAYGAPNITCYNYPQGEPCLWHDFIHPGIVIQEAFGKAVADFIHDNIPSF